MGFPDLPTNAPRVLIVDDEAGNREVLMRVLRKRNYDVHAVADAEAALALIDVVDRLPDVVLLDVMLPGIDGFTLCTKLKTNPLTRLVPVVLLTGLDARHHKIEGINAGADDFLTKPVQMEELVARVSSLVKLKRYTDELESAESVILSLALTVEARDPYTEGHCQRLADYSSALGTVLGLDREDVAALHRGGYLHDVGKIGVPDSVLLKRGPLTACEYRQMQAHTTIGERLCGELRSLRAVRTIVRHHHERLDGSGYPDGLRGTAVPLTAQIVGIVDSYDAMTTTRPYRAALTDAHACDELLRDAAKGLIDREIVQKFIAMDRSAPLAVQNRRG